ncbi:hypothetical protein [Nocardia sp. NBC_01327]|uniref:hypothetical protein n=1 Tax=Nocardia sp. NBC_01327 TaxID=2903593 RepID=UPI002E11DDFC|nr:hypothetical protein OG326_24095 [Nocardia sp. NBC_01327]
MPEQDNTHTPLEAALIAACAAALAHGVDASITPADFGIQRSAAGLTTATYVDSSHAVTVVVNSHGQTTFGIADLDWMHWPDLDVDDDEGCTVCHPDRSEATHFRGVPVENFYLPGDAPAPEAAHV